MKADAVSLLMLFEQKMCLEVPIFQRKYVWNRDDQWQFLWEDIQRKFTEYLDRLMVGWNEPLAYRHHYEWADMLRTLGFKVRVVLIPDILPYPHVVIAARKPL